MPQSRVNPKQTAQDLANRLEDSLAIVKHAMDKDYVRRVANNYTPWSLASGGDNAYSDKYMKNIGKGAIALQQQDMKDTADDEMAKQNDRDARKAKPSSFKKGGIVYRTGMAKVHKGEKVLTVKQQKAAKKKSSGKRY